MLIGEAPCTKDLIACTDHDFTVVSLISIIAIFIIIMIVQKSFSLPVLLVAVIELAIAANLCIPYYLKQELPFVGPILISTIQLGATVDYAILFTDRYMDNRRTMNRKAAIRDTVANCTVSVLTSGSAIIIVGYLMGFICTHGLISQLGSFLGRGAICSVIIVVFALPGMLYLTDGLVRRTTKNAHFVKG
jgi:predicted RND superfamily exporter protein